MYCISPNPIRFLCLVRWASQGPYSCHVIRKVCGRTRFLVSDPGRVETLTLEVAYHGGLIGVILVAWFYTRKAGLDWWSVVDLYIPAIPLGYTFGRLGNFINGELFGRVTTSSIGMYFPMDPAGQLRHPSQLYEAFFEGVFLFAVLWSIRKFKIPKGAMLALYLIGYGTVRFFIEYFRQPDDHIGFVFLSFSMGQILCSLMIAAGVFLYFYLQRREKA